MTRDTMGQQQAVCTRCIYICLAVFCCTLRLVCGELHCYCNFPICSSTNYMCASDIGCYSRLVVSQAESNDPYVHGCIEAVTPEKCEEDSTANDTTTATNSPSRTRKISCCFESMCNFWDRSKPNDAEKSRDNFDDQYSQPYEAVSEQAIWFRAAVIAVPIAGACILIGLIMVAARMLRSEDKQFTKLSVNVRHRAVLQTHSPHRDVTVHRAPQFLDNSRVKNINITGNKLMDPFAGGLHYQHQHHNKISNMNNTVSKVTNDRLHKQRCLNECPRLIPTEHYEKMYRENFDVV